MEIVFIMLSSARWLSCVRPGKCNDFFWRLRTAQLGRNSASRFLKNNRQTHTGFVALSLSRFVLQILLALLFGCLTLTWGQISPGPLSRAHQSLNGATNCTSCHKFGGAASLKCVDCHAEIATRMAARQGLHATYNIPSGSSNECAKCHSEHNGLDFPLIR